MSNSVSWVLPYPRYWAECLPRIVSFHPSAIHHAAPLINPFKHPSHTGFFREESAQLPGLTAQPTATLQTRLSHQWPSCASKHCILPLGHWPSLINWMRDVGGIESPVWASVNRGTGLPPVELRRWGWGQQAERRIRVGCGCLWVQIAH